MAVIINVYHTTLLSNKLHIEIEKFYPGPGLEPRPLALHASATLSYPGQVEIHDRINLL